MSKRLYKSTKNKMIAGVCGGIAEYFNIDPTIVRLVAGVLCCVKGAGLLLYILACIVIPYEDSNEDDVENLKSANVNEGDYGTGKSNSSKLHSDEEFNDFFKK